MLLAATMGRFLDGLGDGLLPLLEKLLGTALDSEGLFCYIASPAYLE